MTTLLGCIADDVTGATDLAGLLARSGIEVSLRFGTPDTEPANTAVIEVIAIKCRNSPVDEAIEQCSQALNWLKKAGATHFYWKYCSTFDSTDKGNIGPVAKALMQILDTKQTIYCPAFPENGRSIYMGNLFVGQQPLAESPMKDHPLTPMQDSNLMRLLSPQVNNENVGLIDRLTVAKGSKQIKSELDKLAADNIQHVITDAVANEDLEQIAKACMDMPLLTGGSALAMFLPDLYVEAGKLSKEEHQVQIPQINKQAILLAGSCSAKTQIQVKNYVKQFPSLKLIPEKLNESGIDSVISWYDEHKDKNPLIYATASADEVSSSQNKLGKHEASVLVEKTLAKLAVHAFNQGIRCFVIAGGETSGSVVNALGVEQMKIGTEIAPGVPWTYAERDNQAIALTLKSGNFGGDNFFTDALDLI